jgi:hypothetical protein
MAPTQLLEREKELIRRSNELARQGRELPWSPWEGLQLRDGSGDGSVGVGATWLTG